jgi:hypothetical protein
MKRLLIAMIAVMALLLAASPALAKKKGFKTGLYTATLKYSTADGEFQNTTFKIKVYKGTCYTRKGAKKNGYCISGYGPSPSIPLDCPDVNGGAADTTGSVFIPNQAWVSSKTGKYHHSFKNQTHGADWEELTTNIKLKRNGRASGDFQINELITTTTTTTVCASKKYTFSAKR